MILKLKDKEYELSTSLRVVYALKEISKARSLQEAINSISRLDLDGQLELLYAAYKAGCGKNGTTICKEDFVGEILDSLGIFAVANKINELADGLLYSGLTPEEIESKKAQVEETVAKVTATGALSSAEDIN